jgi:hypothetical protein
MATKWGMPHCSISDLCLHPTVRALQYIFLQQAGTKNVCWPKEEEEQPRVASGPPMRCQVAWVPSMAPWPPSRSRGGTKANQDADSHHLYKGGIVSLLLAVCDADLQFNCVNAGA